MDHVEMHVVLLASLPKRKIERRENSLTSVSFDDFFKLP
jgi:hypothetical protein